MDKEQQKRVPQGDKNSQVTKSKSTTKTTSTASQRVKSWAPSSKFNKILSNLERSILNQFNGSSHGTGAASGSSNSSSGSSASLIKTKGQSGGKSSAAAALLIGAPTSASHSSPANQVELQRNNNNKQCNGQQVQKDPAPTKGITLQLKSEPTRVKTTLNKYQQQIVSTMRPNHQSMLNSSGGSSSSSNGYNNNNKMSNKLSIPPPHANNEARNQNHRIIFGASAMPNPTKLSSDSIVVGSSATLRPSTNNRLVANTTTSSSRGESIKQNVQQNNAETNLIRNNASPASSAKSLPTTAIATKPTGSQTFNKSINEDEESGFSTYQSRRSLFGDNTKINNTTNINAASQLTGGQNTQQNSNNMIIMQTQTQVPIGAITFNNNSNNNLATPQQLVYNYQYPQLKHPLQQQTINTHNQLVANNQVPIPSTTTIDQSNKNCYQNHPSQLHPFHNTPQQRLNQNHFSDQHLQKNTQFQPIQQQSHQLYNLYALNPGQMQVQVPDNGQQEIYANAPPKPRRYQYYDSSNPPTHLFPPQMIANMTPAASTAMTTSTISSIANGNSIIHQQPMLNHQQQIPYNHPIYNISYLQVPNLYHQHQGLPVQVNNNQHQIPFNGSSDNQQHRPMNPPYPFTKSKSSLDARDLIQYKLDAQNRSNTLRLGAQHRQQNLQHLQQQSIYGSRLDTMNHYPNTLQGQQSGMQFFGNNLQRSKSVSHLLQPDYERQQMTQQHPKEQFVDHKHPINGPKFYSVSSASTTNLNLIGLSNSNQQQISQQQNQFAKLSSHSNHSHNQPPQQFYHDLVQKQGNQLFSATTNTTTTTVQRQQQQQHQHPQRQNNNWQQQQNQVLPSNCNELSNQHPRPRGTTQNPLNNNNSNNNATKTTNVAFTNCATKIVRQQQIFEDGFGKPSLDDKIRYLMIGEDNSNAAANADVMVNSSTTNSQNDKNPIYHPSGNNANLSLQTAWAAQHQQQVSVSVESPVANCNPILKRDSNGNSRQNAIANNNNPNQPPGGQGVGPKTSSAQKNLGDESGLTNRIYINDLASNMGNRQQRQYQVTGDTNHRQHLNQSPSNRNNLNDSDSFRTSKNSSNNSHLIVDLTTPRVLAKTQTTLSSGDLNADANQRRDSCSINQVGLPQQPVEVMAGAQRSTMKASDSSGMEQQQREHQTTRTNPNVEDLSGVKNDLNNKLINSNFNNRADSGANSICERTAPYYYSDLKSEEQRQALLSIVQHKSLSPPPQLLSRSTDQSSTRLALKSATLHPGHMRMLNEAKERQQSKAQGTNGFNTTKNLKYHMSNSDFNSTSNISKNIDKLFESPAQQTRINAVQSMLALNDYVCEDSCQTSQQLSNFQATSESTSVGYFSGDMKNKNFSKSKSLENINQGIFNDQAIISSPHPTHIDTCRSKKGGNPVYENIRRSDKLMSAINNSTTCLSTSTSRFSTNRPKPPSYMVESQNGNSEESTDSILGSSLDESDSSLDLIDEIKISPSDNHLSDISQLIEQLKVNHSKLSEEYTSTMARIAKTISTKNKQANVDHKNDKLSRRLQLLEQKSKKCESRSKNQLALIQMMEKVLQQSKARTTIAPSLDDNSLSSSIDSSSKPCIINNIHKERISTSPSLSFDYQNLKQSVQSSHTSPTCSNSTSTLNSQHSLISDTIRNFNDQSPKTSNTNKQQHGVIKAIVTEGQTKIISEVKRQDSEVGSGQVSLSTRHHQQNLQARNSLGAGSVPSAEMMKLQLDTRTTTNPFSDANEEEGDDDDDSTSTSSESSVEEVRRISNNNSNKLSKEIENKNSSSNSATDGLDEEDFIEFLTTNTSEHHHHSSQFGASQFSASDFNSGQASTGGLGDARSAITNKSNNSYPSKNHLFSNGGAMNTTGILKSAKNGFNCPKNSNNNNNIENNINNNNINVSRNGNNNGTIDDGKDSIDRSKFNNVLGNVIDVDVCPMNNLSESSPVNNRASCLN